MVTYSTYSHPTSRLDSWAINIGPIRARAYWNSKRYSKQEIRQETCSLAWRTAARAFEACDRGYYGFVQVIFEFIATAMS